MSNLIKARQVNKTKDRRVIDNNELIKIKMERLLLSDEFNENEFFEQSDEIDPGKLLTEDHPEKSEEKNSSEEKNNEEFISGIKAVEVELEPEVDYEAEGQKLIDEAKSEAENEAEKILKNARKKADELTKSSYDEGYNKGFSDGKSDLEAEIQSAEQEIEKMREAFQHDCEKERLEMEPLLVDTILKVFRQLTDVLSEDKKDIIIQLVNNVLKKINISHDFIIRVSKDDYGFLIENKNKIYGAVIGEGSIEVVEDVTMKKNQCIIETGSGMYDCSLDVQLENLIEEIKMLSCINICD